MHSRRIAVLFAFVAALAGCERPAVEWSEPDVIADPAGASRLLVDPSGHARFVTEPQAPTTLPRAPGLCATSLRTVSGTSHLYAVWWNVRPDSSAILYLAASSDTGKTWGTAVAVDTTDISSRGCSRPPPSPTTVGDDFYVAYSMVAPEGTGVFFAHFMSSMLHAPVAVIYGERLVATAIATEGDRVAVAYEEPNGKRQQIDVALSATQGHLFEVHTTATRAVDVAMSPSIALAGDALAISWIAQRFDAGAGATVVRVGHLK
jgi:hypothetical protein